MEQIKQVIENAIKQIQEQKSYTVPEINNELRLIEDLGFASLDIAQLIAHLEMELDVDPFAAGALISNIRTVGSLREIYQSCLAEKSGEVYENE